MNLSDLVHSLEERARNGNHTLLLWQEVQASVSPLQQWAEQGMTLRARITGRTPAWRIART